MSKLGIVCLTLLCVIVLAGIIAGIYFGCTPSGKAAWNNYKHTLQEVDDKTNYETKKKVEDTCRAMVAQYEADKLKYEQYKDSDNEEKQSWAENAKMRANDTAASYNNYILENSYVWEDNIPSDIKTKLDYID
jgi:putative IMPACT (imprinted ancient) family translation regulator